MVFEQGGEGRAGEGNITLDDDTIYFDEGDADFAPGFVTCFGLGQLDDEGITLFFDDGLLFGEIDGWHGGILKV